MLRTSGSLVSRLFRIVSYSYVEVNSSGLYGLGTGDP